MLMESDQVSDQSTSAMSIDAGQVDVVKERLNEINIIDIVKHQKVVKFDNSSDFRTLFEEFYVAVKDLNKRFDKTIDLASNKWLFLYLTETLDKKTMYSFLFSDIQNKPQKISLNLNLSTVFLPEFDEFSKLMAEQNQKVIVEIQVIDILNNLKLYFDAKEFLHEKGYEILIDAVNVEMLESLDVEKFGADYIKFFWHSLMEEYEADNDKIRQKVIRIGEDKVILAKCLNAQALRWGVKNGIRAFQGPYIDLFDATLTQKKCPNGKNCAIEECLKRKNVKNIKMIWSS